MAILSVGGLQFDADLIAFDKDGTLVDFDRMWGRLAEVWVEQLVGDEGDPALADELYRSWGYDPHQRRTAPQSPLSIGTTEQLRTIAAVALYRHGLPWTDAEDRTLPVVRSSGPGLTLSDLVYPTGDVAGLMRKIKAAGALVAVVTTDSRAETLETMQLMGVAHLVDDLVCGDDGLPSKPAPDMLLAACQHLKVDPGRTAAVGDTLGDLLMAQRAGAGLKIAVLTGPGEPADLEAHADVVVPSIDGICVG